MQKKYDVVIIGAGPAGMSAAIYLKRAGVNPLILEGEVPGGTLNKTHRIDNYPGYTDKEGTTLAFRMYSQIEELNIELKVEKVIDIKRENDLFSVITNSDIYHARYIIISTGKIPRKLNVPDAYKYENKGISYCAICDGALYKNKDVAIIGGGNSAMEAASYMSNIANKVYVINRSSSLRADKSEQDDILSRNNVEIIYDSNVNEIIDGNNFIKAIKLEDGKKLDVNAIFVCIGQESNMAYYQNLNLKTDESGIKVDSDMKTSDDKVYACGDAISKNLYQVVTATSEGAIAATSIIKKLKNKKTNLID